MLHQTSRYAGHSSAAARRRVAPSTARTGPVYSAFEARQSVDPLANKPRPAAAAPGTVYPVYSPAEVEAVLAEHKDKLVVIMCKASHCKPCKTFMPKYERMAAMLGNSVLLSLTGDHSQETKKLMMEWGVKSTPTFRMYRGGEVVGSVTGAKEAKVLPVLTGLLLEGEAGRHLAPGDLEEDSSTDDDA